VFNYNIELPDETKFYILREVLHLTRVYLNKLPEVITLIESAKKDTDPGTLFSELKNIEILNQQLVIPEDPSKIQPAQIFENKTLLAMFDKIKAVRSMIVTIPGVK
jgi:hypothetical protein